MFTVRWNTVRNQLHVRLRAMLPQCSHVPMLGRTNGFVSCWKAGVWEEGQEIEERDGSGVLGRIILGLHG